MIPQCLGRKTYACWHMYMGMALAKSAGIKNDIYLFKNAETECSERNKFVDNLFYSCVRLESILITLRLHQLNAQK